MRHSVINSYISLIVVVALFVAASYLVQTNIGFFESTIGSSTSGMLGYVLLVITGIVVAPVSSLPLLPIAVGLWGPNTAALLSILGWFVGAGIAYELSCRFGKDLIKRIIKLETIERYSAGVSGRYGFVGLVLLRMSVPVDILSYGLGLFTSVNRKLYYSSTAIGITPFAFVWAYVGALNYWYQIAAFIFAGVTVYAGLKLRA